MALPGSPSLLPVLYAQPEAWQAFVDHFERGAYFDCHEILEALWLQAQTVEKMFLQALIQYVVALHHWQQGQLKGTLSLLRKAQTKVQYLSDPSLKVWQERVSTALTEAQKQSEAGVQPRPPEIKL